LLNGSESVGDLIGKKVNLVIMAGVNPDCVHHEYITDERSICSKCGQIKDYSLVNYDLLTDNRAKGIERSLIKRKRGY